MGIYQSKITYIKNNRIISIKCSYLPSAAIIIIIGNLMLFIPSIVYLTLTGFENILFPEVLFILLLHIPVLIIFNFIIMKGNGPQNTMELDINKKTVRLINKYPLPGFFIPCKTISFDDILKIHLNNYLIAPYPKSMATKEVTDILIKYKGNKKARRVIKRANMDYEKLNEIIEEINKNF